MSETRRMARLRWYWFWRLLIRLRVPERSYYWLLDRLTNNAGWRPLNMRHPEHLTRPSHRHR